MVFSEMRVTDYSHETVNTHMQVYQLSQLSDHFKYQQTTAKHDQQTAQMSLNMDATFMGTYELK